MGIGLGARAHRMERPALAGGDDVEAGGMPPPGDRQLRHTLIPCFGYATQNQSGCQNARSVEGSSTLMQFASNTDSER